MAKGWKFKNGIPQVRAALRALGEQVTQQHAEAVLARASEEVPQPGTAPYSSGALKASGHVVSRRTSGYGAAIAKAKEARDEYFYGGNAHRFAVRLDASQILPEIVPDTLRELPPGVYRAIVYYPLDYAVDVHDGFYWTRPIPARPWLQESVYASAYDYIKAVEAALKNLKNVGV